MTGTVSTLRLPKSGDPPESVRVSAVRRRNMGLSAAAVDSCVICGSAKSPGSSMSRSRRSSGEPSGGGVGVRSSRCSLISWSDAASERLPPSILGRSGRACASSTIMMPGGEDSRYGMTSSRSMNPADAIVMPGPFHARRM